MARLRINAMARAACQTPRPLRPQDITVGGGSVELYGTGRYIAVTGRTFGDSPQRLGELQPVIDEWVESAAA